MASITECGGEGREFEPCVSTSAAPSSIKLQLLEWSALTDLLMHARTCRDSGEGEVIIDTVPAIWPVRRSGWDGSSQYRREDINLIKV